MARGNFRRDFTPDFDPDCGDFALTSARQDIVIGRWQGLRELLRSTGPDWLARGHRVRLLAQACAGSSTVESWLAAEPNSGDALVLRAATETARAFNVAITAGRGVPIDTHRIDTAVLSCLKAAESYPDDPTPWISLISVARLYPKGCGGRNWGAGGTSCTAVTRSAWRVISRCSTTTPLAGTARTA